MVAARTVQGIGAALLLAGSVPLLTALTGSRRRGAALWGTAAVVGAAVGPALGGALTQVYEWPSIFVAQVPLALAALAATIAVRVPPSVPATVPPDPHRRARWASGTALALLSAALVGALFLSVVLIINGWGHPPLLAAGLVEPSALGALAAGPVVKRSAPRAAVAGGTLLLLAAGLVAMALLPEPSLFLISAALSLCGLGIGLSMPALAEASLRGPSHASSGTWSVGARHAGLVVGLVLLAPILAGSLLQVRDRAELAGAAALIDAPLSIEEKVDVGQALDRAIATAPAGETPDLRAAVATGGDPDDPARVALLDDLDALIAATITQTGGPSRSAPSWPCWPSCRSRPSAGASSHEGPARRAPGDRGGPGGGGAPDRRRAAARRARRWAPRRGGPVHPRGAGLRGRRQRAGATDRPRGGGCGGLPAGDGP